MKLDKHFFITFGILAGLVVGFVVGQLFHSFADEATRTAAAETFNFLGTTFFMNLLKMILVPLVASSVICGIASIGEPSSLGRIGGYTILYYFATMMIAVILGLTLVNTIRPGVGVPDSVREKGEQAYAGESAAKRQMIEEKGKGGLWAAFKNIANQLIPSNPFGDAAGATNVKLNLRDETGEGSPQLLPVITFSLLLGIAILVVGEKAKPLLAFSEAVFAAIMKLVDWILCLAPLGVMFLAAYTVTNIGLQELIGPLLLYILTVLVGLAIHGFGILPLVLWFFGRTNPYRYMHQMREALMTAFGTDSSSATLPVTMEVAETVGGVSKKAAGFVLPLGATINMDGTALYEAVAVVFLFQCYGVDLSATQIGVIAITATLAAVGAAGIPSAGLVTMVIVVQAVNAGLPAASRLPLAAVGVILGIDRILDMCRTTVNVWGDAVGAKIITRIAPDS